MDVTLLRSWLGLPPGPWPPDHYTLLGLAPGAADPAALEPRVLERMDLLRRHQLLHPELVTEGMNRLAQALITLTDPAAKAAYDAQLGPREAAPPRTPVAEAAAPVRPVGPPDVVVEDPAFDDVFTDDAGPVPADAGDVTQVLEPPAGPAAGLALPAPPPGTLVVSVAEVDEPPAAPAVTSGVIETPVPDGRPAVAGGVVEAVAVTPPAPPPGLAVPAARRWVYARLALVRKALRTWEKLRPVLADPTDPVDRPGRVLVLLDAVAEVRPLLPRLAGVVGGVGEPGGLVAAVLGQPLLLDTFRRLLPDQRQAVAIDWRRGQAELQREYARLRGLARSGRAAPSGPRGWPALIRWVRETPEIGLVLLAALAVVLALLRGTAAR